MIFLALLGFASLSAGGKHALRPDGSSVPDTIFTTTCGWLRCALHKQAEYDSFVEWLELPGSRDTLRNGYHPRSTFKPFSRPRWTVSRMENSQPEHWKLLDSKLAFEQVGDYKSPLFFPVAQDLRWSQDGHVWRILAKKHQSPLVPPRRAPPELAPHLVWKVTPPLLPNGSKRHIAGLGTAEWTGAYRWHAPDTLLAQAILRPDKNRQTLLGKHPLPAEIPLHVRFDGDRIMLDFPETGMFRLPRLPDSGLALLAGVSSSQGTPQLVGDSSLWHLGIDSSDRYGFGRDDFDDTLSRDSLQRLAIAEAPSPKAHSSFLWSGSGTVQRIASLDISPDQGLVFDTGFAQILSRQNGITFAVSDVPPETLALPKQGRAAWLENQGQLSEFEGLAAIAGNPGADSLLEESPSHAFLDVFVRAWNEHRPVRLSPDAVWMLLLEGLVSRVEANADSCREALVKHADGKKVVQIPLPIGHVENLDEDSTWEFIAKELLAKVSTDSRQNPDSAFLPVFSTTTPTRALATRMRVLQMYSHYFDYRALAACGIPRITLEGTAADWRRIRDHLPNLAGCGLADWSTRMKPVLEEFVRASEGKPSLSFWRSFVRFTPAIMCGAAPVVDGWISAFFPVDRDGKPRQFLAPMDYGLIPDDNGTFPFVLVTPGLPDRHFTVRSGFSGNGQDADGTLFPELGWSVWEGQTENVK